MPAARARVVSLLEWVAAAFVLAAVAGLGSGIVREIRTVDALTPVIARETLPDPPVPAGVPSRAVSVPMLLLPDGTAVRAGEGIGTVTLRLGDSAGSQTVERAPNGLRLTRFFDHAGMRFVLVFEPFERNGEPRVAAIYVR
jgi:hypothetical protein